MRKSQLINQKLILTSLKGMHILLKKASKVSKFNKNKKKTQIKKRKSNRPDLSNG